MKIRFNLIIILLTVGLSAGSVHSYFEKEFPYRIQKWEETYRGLAAMGAKVMTTRATRTHTIMDAYWQHHGNRDRALLKKLGLSAKEMGNN